MRSKYQITLIHARRTSLVASDPHTPYIGSLTSHAYSARARVPQTSDQIHPAVFLPTL